MLMVNIGDGEVKCHKKDVKCYRGDRCSYPKIDFYCDGLDSSGTECQQYYACV